MASGEDPVKKSQSALIISLRKENSEFKKILNDMVDRKKQLGVYMTTVMPYTRAGEWLKDNGISKEGMFYLDPVSREGKTAEDNVFFLRDPADLTEFSVVITEVMENRDIKFLVIDNMKGLEVHAETQNIVRFVQALIPFLKKMNKRLFLVYEGTESPQLLDFVRKVSDIQF